MKKTWLILALFFVELSSILACNQNINSANCIQKDGIATYTLDNGLTIIVCPKKDASLVSIQLWYNVGSKHEKDGQRGIAHLIEHMIFKGTQMLSESDIDSVTSKLSGYCNAFTGYDYTGYLFDIPVANWDKVLPLMADCMQNCTFKQEHLNSEMKAVIQELKMNRDNYRRSLWLEMITNLFESHPYHFPVIGYKQDLWSVLCDTLKSFYKKYYTPDNAAIVVVGDVQAADVYEKIAQNFACIPAGNGWNNEQFYSNEDIKTKTITLHRKVAQAQGSLFYILPGFKQGNQFDVELLSYVLARGTGSRLHKLLVDELQLVTSVDADSIDLFDQTLLFIDFSPLSQDNIDLIVSYIQEQINDIAQGGLQEKEIVRAEKLAQLEWQLSLQNSQRQAYQIGKAFIGMKDPYYTVNYGKNVSIEQFAFNLQALTANYCTQVHCNQGRILPISQAHEKFLVQLQEKSDIQDVEFLGLKPRDAVVEPARYAHTVELNENKPFHSKHPQTVMLDNGMQLVSFHDASTDFVEIVLALQTNHLYDPEGLQGLSNVVSSLILEGTKNYPGRLLCDELDNYGIVCTVQPGMISMTCLKDDLQQAIMLLYELVTQANLDYQDLEKIKQKISVDLKHFWDTPSLFNHKLSSDLVYQSHPYSKMVLGTQQAIAAITVDDCKNFYKKMMTPQNTQCIVVGNVENSAIQDVVVKIMGGWQGEPVQPLVYSPIPATSFQELSWFANRDQILLSFVGLSVDRMHEDYDKILLFDQILTGGLSRSMKSRLFALRQQSGLFYTAGGSLLAGAGRQPGMISIRTLVSVDRVDEAQKAFLDLIDTAIDSLSEQELDEAKRIIINSCQLLFETNAAKASTFLFLKKYDLPADYFEKRIEALQSITVEQVQQAVKNILSTDKVAVIKIGRV